MRFSSLSSIRTATRVLMISGALVTCAAVPALAHAASTSATGESTQALPGVADCQLNPAAKSEWLAAGRAGESAAQICSTPDLVAAGTSLVVTDGSVTGGGDTPGCGSIYLTVYPLSGSFDENEEWEETLPETLLEYGTFTGQWTNFTTGGGNFYDWEPTLEFNEWSSGKRNVNSKAGKIGVNNYGSGATEADGDDYECSYGPSGIYDFTVS